MQVCEICVALFGVGLNDESKTFDTYEELYEHMENVHGMFVMQEGETEEQAKEVYNKDNRAYNNDISIHDKVKHTHHETRKASSKGKDAFKRAVNTFNKVMDNYGGKK